jgi:hypothetical protein
MERPRRRLPATELRVHLGEALKALEGEDLIIEKGGVPVALLTRYDGTVYDGNPNGWPGALAAMNAGWAGLDSDSLNAALYAARASGTKPPLPDLSEDGDNAEDAEDGEVSPGLRLLQPRDEPPVRRVADEPDDGGYRA